MDGSRQTLSSGHSRAAVHMNTQQFQQHVQNLSKSSQTKFQGGRGIYEHLPSPSLEGYWQLLAARRGRASFLQV